MSRRKLGLAAAAVAAISIPFALLAPGATAAPGLAGVSLAGPGDSTPPYGPFGFTTKGLGATDNYGEPSLSVAPDGVHLVASTPGSTPDGGGVQYWHTANRGKTWKTTFSTSPQGGGDSELEYMPDGSIISADLEVTDSYIHRSTDHGKTWAAVGKAGVEQDRQWFAHSPDGKTAYLVYHDFVLEAEMFARSSDGGKTWPVSDGANQITSVDQITAPGIAKTQLNGTPASLLDQGVNTFSGPMLVDNNGKDLYVVYSISDLQSNIDPNAGVPPFGGTRGLVVMHSDQAGAAGSWTSHYAVTVPKNIQGSQEYQTATLFPWGMIDAKGTVYVVFNSTVGAPDDHFHQYYVYSTDKGKTFSKPVKLDKLPLGTGSATFAAGAAGAPGVIDVAWYESPTGVPSDDNSTWYVHFAQVVGADTPKPKVTEQAVTTIPNHTGGQCLQGILCGIGPGSSDRSLLDFFEVVINPKTGMAGIAYADNHRLGLDAQENKIGEVVYAAQTTGRSALTPIPVEPPAKPPAKPPVNAGPNLAATGMAPMMTITALLLLTVGLLIRRRVRRTT
ncbi:MAG: hypothetical protein QOG53_3596 [Frankiales bacterium]|jgi:hypothetical protein|nr:hypothetical protein [Frankiales bacterium]